MEVKNSRTAVFSAACVPRDKEAGRKGRFTRCAKSAACKTCVGIFLCVLLLLSLLTGCVSDGREALLQKAEDYLERDETARAKRILDIYLTQDSSSIKAQELQALYFHKTDQFLLEAEVYCRLIEKAAKEGPDDRLEQYYLACAAAYLTLKNKQDALEIYQEGVKRLPSSARLRQKEEALNKEVNPPPKKAMLAALPDKNGAYAMTQTGEKTELRIAFSKQEDARREVFLQKAETFEKQTGHDVTLQETSGPRTPQNGENGPLCLNAELLFITEKEELEELEKAGLLVSLEEMRTQLPALGEQYRPELLPRAQDGKLYALPVSITWTGLYVNKEVLKECAVSLPEAGYTWEGFLADCEAVKGAGYLPIAAQVTAPPYAWTDWCFINNTDGREADDWNAEGEKADTQKTAALEDIKNLYEKDYLGEQEPKIQQDAIELLLQNKAAFLLGDAGLGGNLEKLPPDEAEKICLIPPPVKDVAEAGTVAGESTGSWALSREAWDDPNKRPAALSLYSYLTARDTLESYTGKYELTPLDTQKEPTPQNGPQKRARESFFSAVTGICPYALRRLPAETQVLWCETLLRQVLMEELTPHEAAEQMTGQTRQKANGEICERAAEPAAADAVEKGGRQDNEE